MNEEFMTLAVNPDDKFNVFRSTVKGSLFVLIRFSTPNKFADSKHLGFEYTSCGTS